MSPSTLPTESSRKSSPQASSVPTQDLPCADCRRRKVRCNKTEPCSNCVRFGVECVYDDPGRLGNRRASKSAGDPLARRVAELEELVQNLSRRPQQGNPMDNVTENILQRMNSSVPSSSTKTPADGRLVFDSDRSRYLHRGFWAAMYDEIRDLKFTLHEEPQSKEDSLFFPFLRERSEPSFAHPPTQESDFLVQAFFEKVDPFVKILHRPTLMLELNHFRRGVSEKPAEFQTRLFAVYALSLLSMCETLVEYRLHEPKKVLLSRYRGYIEQGLSRLNLTTTQSLSTLQTFLLYITLLFWTGEMLHVSTLLGVALTMARRMGLNHDGTHFHLSPWAIELRRRMWYHLVLLDAWCVENHGVQPLIQRGEADTSLPDNLDDSRWDTCEFSTLRPEPSYAFSDMTIALVHYELASLTAFILSHPYNPSTTISGYMDLQNEVLRQASHRIEILYLRNLDVENNIMHRLTRDLFDMAMRRLRLMQLQPLVHAKGVGTSGLAPEDDSAQRASLEAKMYQLATEYCKMSVHLISFYTPYSLDWVIVRAFSWHSVATMLSMVLRHEALSCSPEARAASQRIERLFRNRPSMDYLAGNDNLWEPLRRLHEELAARERVAAATPCGVAVEPATARTTASPDASMAGEADTISLTSTNVDPALFGLVGFEGDMTGLEPFGDFGTYM